MRLRPLYPFVRVGQVVTKAVRDEQPVVKVRVQKMRLDPRLLMYFPAKKDYWSRDYKNEAKIGDIVVIKNLPTSEGKRLNTYIHSMLFRTGNTIDPVTNRKCRGLDYVDVEERENEPTKRKDVELASAV